MSESTPTLSRAFLRKFGLTTAAMIGLLFGLFIPWLRNEAYPLFPWQIAGVLGFCSLLVPTTLRPVYPIWMKFAEILGWINSRIILGIMFYLVVLPMGMLMKLSGNDPIRRKMIKNCRSYRVESNVRPIDHLEKPY